VKKTIAAGGASLLGLSAVGLGTVPAMAAGEPDCTAVAEHEVRTTGSVADWYMACIPQYALGTVDFTIVSDVDFPAGFLELDDPGVTSTSTNTGAAANAYLGVVPEAAGFRNLDLEPSESGSDYQTYSGAMMFEVASVGAYTGVPPAGCAGTFTGMYTVNYAPTTVTFTQIVDGVEWRYDLVVAPAPLFLGLSILGTGVFDPAGNMCVTSNGISTFANNAQDQPLNFAEVAGHATINDDLETLMPYFGSAKSLPDVSRYVPPTPVPEQPLLPPTGVDIAAPLGLAATFLALGVAGGYLRRRRVDA
jgi:hypothetical protein